MLALCTQFCYNWNELPQSGVHLLGSIIGRNKTGRLTVLDVLATTLPSFCLDPDHVFNPHESCLLP